MLDGQNLFDACLSEISHREWELDETVYRLARQGRIPPMIVVGMGQLVRDTRPMVALPRRVFIGFGGRESPPPEQNARLLGALEFLCGDWQPPAGD